MGTKEDHGKARAAAGGNGKWQFGKDGRGHRLERPDRRAVTPDRGVDPDLGTGGSASLADEAVFEALFRKHYAGLCRFANGIVKAPDVAEEVVQATFASLWRVRESIRFRSTARAWLFSAVRNRSLNHTRHSALERTVESAHRIAPTAVTEPTRPPDPLRSLETREAADHVRRAIEMLPPRSREVIRLRWLHGLSHAEIAETMHISRKAVERNITRGLLRLRELLGPGLY